MVRRCIGEWGSSLVESALILPTLLILFMGAVEVSYFLLAQVQVTNTAREGARYGSLCRLNDTCDGGGQYTDLTEAVKAAVYSEATLLDMTDGGNTTVVVQPSNLATVPAMGTPITVTVTYNHSTLFISSFVPAFPQQVPIQRTVVMRFDK